MHAVPTRVRSKCAGPRSNDVWGSARSVAAGSVQVALAPGLDRYDEEQREAAASDLGPQHSVVGQGRIPGGRVNPRARAPPAPPSSLGLR